jgi:hypothetical protein
LDLTALMHRMDQLITDHAEGDVQNPTNVVRAGIIAAEEAAKAGVVSGDLWEECGAHLLSSHFAYFRGVPVGTYTTPAISQRFREMQEGATSEGLTACGPTDCGFQNCHGVIGEPCEAHDERTGEAG